VATNGVLKRTQGVFDIFEETYEVVQLDVGHAELRLILGLAHAMAGVTTGLQNCHQPQAEVQHVHLTGCHCMGLRGDWSPLDSSDYIDDALNELYGHSSTTRRQRIMAISSVFAGRSQSDTSSLVVSGDICSAASRQWSAAMLWQCFGLRIDVS
jgi:hypothetical protein